MSRVRKRETGEYALNYARGESNGNAKLSDHEVTLMLDYRDSCQDEIDSIEIEIDKLKDRRAHLKKVMSKRYIADMFEISDTHCYRIFNGSQR